jgi:hypothetical protein
VRRPHAREANASANAATDCGGHTDAKGEPQERGHAEEAVAVVAENPSDPVARSAVTGGSILLRLRNPIDGAIGPADSAVVTITDNDAAGSIQLGAATYSIAENGGPALVTVARSGGTAGGASVAYATSSGAPHGATPGDD